MTGISRVLHGYYDARVPPSPFNGLSVTTMNIFAQNFAQNFAQKAISPILFFCCGLLMSGCGVDSVTDASLLNDDFVSEEIGIGKTGDLLSDELVDLLKGVSPNGKLSFYQMPNSSQFDRIPQDPLNPLSSKKVKLGRLLYHETAMATNSATGNPESFSCASCHFAQAGFQAGLAQGVADGGSGFAMRVNVHGTDSDIQPIRTPSSMNTAYQIRMLWNGQFGGPGNEGSGNSSVDFVQLNQEGLHGLEVQAIKGLAVHRMEDGAAEVVDFRKYENYFRQVFGDSDAAVSRRNAGLAIAAFERTILANEAPFQRWLKGNPRAMSAAEKRGALVFFGDKASCSTCHTGPALNSDSFHALGMLDLDEGASGLHAGAIPAGVRLGRGGFTGNSEDYYKFKTPQLYNLTDSPFYGHGASFRSVREVVEYKNAGLPENTSATNISPLFAPLGLSDQEIDDLVTFLETGLNDPELMRYVPNKLPSGLCITVNDDQSQEDLGCAID